MVTIWAWVVVDEAMKSPSGLDRSMMMWHQRPRWEFGKDKAYIPALFWALPTKTLGCNAGQNDKS